MAAIQCTGCEAVGESSLGTLYCASCYERIEATLEIALSLLPREDISAAHDFAMLDDNKPRVAELKLLLQEKQGEKVMSGRRWGDDD